MATSTHWATGITVAYRRVSSDGTYGWAASLDFYDDAFATGNTAGQPISTEGTLRVRYPVHAPHGTPADALAAAIQALTQDAARMGITWGQAVAPALYTDGPDWRDEWQPDAPLTREQARDVVRQFATTWSPQPGIGTPSTEALQ